MMSPEKLSGNIEIEMSFYDSESLIAKSCVPATVSPFQGGKGKAEKYALRASSLPDPCASPDQGSVRLLIVHVVFISFHLLPSTNNNPHNSQHNVCGSCDGLGVEGWACPLLV
jgi:hypothetical protein